MLEVLRKPQTFCSRSVELPISVHGMPKFLTVLEIITKMEFFFERTFRLTRISNMRNFDTTSVPVGMSIAFHNFEKSRKIYIRVVPYGLCGWRPGGYLDPLKQSCRYRRLFTRKIKNNFYARTLTMFPMKYKINVKTLQHVFVTRNSADADKPARRIYRSVKVTKHSTIPYIRYSFLLCNSNRQ